MGFSVSACSSLDESCADADRESCKWCAIGFVFRLAGHKRNAIPEKILELVSRALQDRVDLLTHISGAQVPGVLKSLRSLLMSGVPRRFIARALGSVDILIPLCVHHEQRIATTDALHILHLFLLALCFEDIHGFTRCLSKVLVVLPAIFDQLQQCVVEQEDSVKLQSEISVVHFLAFLAEVSTGDLIHLNKEILSLVWSKLASILDNPQVLQNFAGLLRRDDHEHVIHQMVMYVLRVTTRKAGKRFRIVQIPGTLERIVKLVNRRDFNAFLFVQMLIRDGKLNASAPRYLLKCLCCVVSANIGESSSEALYLLGLCALRNRNALHYLVDMLHESVRCTLRAEAVNHLIAHVSDNPDPPTRTLLASLQSLVYDSTRQEWLGPACDLQLEVICVLVSLVKRLPQSQWQIAKYVTGLSARDLRMYMLMKACDKPKLKRKGSMDTAARRLQGGITETRTFYFYFSSFFSFS